MKICRGNKNIVDKKLNAKKIILTLISFIVFWAMITDAWGYSNFIFNNNIGTYIYGYISRLYGYFLQCF